jgi:hypothetical protein
LQYNANISNKPSILPKTVFLPLNQAQFILDVSPISDHF